MAKKKLTIDTQQTTQTFQQNEPLYKRLEDEAVFTIKTELDKTEIKVHSIPSRIKTLDSFLNKINLYQIEKPFEMINDIIGLRVICLFLTDIEKIGDIIRKTFDVLKEDNKIDNSKFASFGYLSFHFIVKLGKGFSGTRYNDICEIPFEIQVRTIAMDAWANISHYLEYKTDKDIPEELKRDFYALSGMFYVADKHFQMFFEQRMENTEFIEEVFEKGNAEDIKSQPINLDTLKVFLRDKLPEYNAYENLSNTVTKINQAGFNTIGEINELLEIGKETGIKYLEDMLKNEKDSAFNDMSDAKFLTLVLTMFSFDFFVVFMKRPISESNLEIERANWNKAFHTYRQDIL